MEREPVERPCHSGLVAETFVDGQGLAEERLRLLVVPARPSHQRESGVRLRDALLVLERSRELESVLTQLLGTVVVALIVREDAVPGQRTGTNS